MDSFKKIIIRDNRRYAWINTINKKIFEISGHNEKHERILNRIEKMEKFGEADIKRVSPLDYVFIGKISRSDTINFIKEYQPRDPDKFLIIQNAIEEKLEGKMIVRNYNK